MACNRSLTEPKIIPSHGLNTVISLQNSMRANEKIVLGAIKIFLSSHNLLINTINNISLYTTVKLLSI